MLKLQIWSLLLAGMPLLLRAEPLLGGVLIANGRVLLALRDTTDDSRAQWTEVGGKFRDYIVESYDPKAEVARLRQKDRVFDATLVKPATLPPTVDLSTASDDELRIIGLHRIKSGDTLGGVARKHGVKVAELAVWNNISDPAKIYPGDILFVTAPPPNKVP
jgi:LysM repeat protein